MAYGRIQSPFENYRQSNLLSPQRQSTTAPTFDDMGSGIGVGFGRPQPQDTPEPERDPMRGYDDEIMGLMKPSAGLLAYKNYLSTMPNREEYKPSGWTRAAAAMGGFSAGLKDAGQGIKTAQTMNESGYRNALEDFSNKGYGMKETADIEQTDRANQVKVLQQARAMGLDYDKLRFEENKFNRTAGQKDTENQTNRMRADAYVKSLNRGDFEKIEDVNGGVTYVNKHDPNDRISFTAQQMGGGTLGAGQLGVSRTNAGANVMGANASMMNATENAGKNYWERTRLAEPPSPGGVKDAYAVAAEKLLRDPDFAQFLAQDPASGKITLKPGMEKHPAYQDFSDALDATAKAVTDGTVYGTGRPRGSSSPQPPLFGPGSGTRYRLGGGQ